MNLWAACSAHGSVFMCTHCARARIRDLVVTGKCAWFSFSHAELSGFFGNLFVSFINIKLRAFFIFLFI
jgi:hypothetical protein